MSRYPKLFKFLVEYETETAVTEYFLCEAEDAQHAVEQCYDYVDCIVHDVYELTSCVFEH